MGRGRGANKGVAGGAPTPPRGWNWQDGDVGLRRTRNGVEETIDVNSGRRGIVSIDYPGGRIAGRDLEGYLTDDGEANYGRIVRDLNRGALPNTQGTGNPLTAAGRARAEAAATPINPFTATEEDRTRFNIDSTAQAARPFAPADVQDAWNRTSAAELGNLLPENDAATAISRALQMPTPREAFGRGGPERATFSNRAKKILSEALSGAGTGYSELRRSMGIDGFPAATDIVSRRASGGTRAVGSLSEFVKSLPADMAPDVKARVTALADAMGGLGLAKERIYETQILTRGSNTPKGRVLSRVVNQAQTEARRMANEINRLMGVTGRPSGNGLPPAGTPGREAYKRMMTDISNQADKRNRVGRGPIPAKMSAYSDAELSVLNND